MNNSINAYKKTCEVLGIEPAEIKDIPIRDDATLVIVPDKVFTWTKIKKLAVAFGKDQPYKTWAYDKLYKLYTSEQLSGKSTGKDYRVLYIPKKFNVDADTASAQAEKHKKDHVPTVLETVCFWFALRENGDTLDWNSTYIRHFDLPPKSSDGWSVVPRSFVDGDGEPDLRHAVADAQRGARVAVGYENFDLNPSLSSFPLEEQKAINLLKERGYKIVKEF